jgi:archaellum component FlaC
MPLFKTPFEKELLSDRAALRKKVEHLEDRITDLSQQLSDVPKARRITPLEEQDITRLRFEHETMNNEINEIALYLRHNFSGEIAQGHHAGKSISQIVKMYLGTIHPQPQKDPQEEPVQ